MTRGRDRDAEDVTVNNQGKRLFLADGRRELGNPPEAMADPVAGQSIARFVVGLLLLAADALTGSLERALQSQDPQTDASPPDLVLPADTVGGQLRHLALGLLAREQSHRGGRLRAGYELPVQAMRWVLHQVDRSTDNWLMRPLRRPIETHVWRWEQEAALLIEQGKREEDRSKAQAAENISLLVDDLVSQVVDSPELDRLIMELVGQKSASFGASVVDNLRTLTATADDALEGVLRRLLRRAPRRALPPSPLEGQPQTMYTSRSLMRGGADYD